MGLVTFADFARFVNGLGFMRFNGALKLWTLLTNHSWSSVDLASLPTLLTSMRSSSMSLVDISVGRHLCG